MPPWTGSLTIRLAERPQGRRGEPDHERRERQLAQPDIDPDPAHRGRRRRGRPRHPGRGRRRPPRAGPSTAGPAGSSGARLVERGAEEVPAELEWVGDRDDDPLAVAQQVRQVVGDEVADGDRDESGADGGQADQSSDRRARGRPRARGTRAARPSRPRSDGRPKRSNQICVCDRPSNRIEATPIATSTTWRRRPAGPEQPGRERPAGDHPILGCSGRPNGASRLSVPNQTENVSPCARQASRPKCGHARAGSRAV